MATVKINLIVKKSTARKDGTYPLKMIVEHKGKHLLINLKEYCTAENWTGESLNRKQFEYKKTNLRLRRLLNNAEELISLYQTNMIGWTCEQLRDFIKIKIFEEKEAAKQVSKETTTTPTSVKTLKLFEYGKQLIKHMEDIDKQGTAVKYAQVLRTFKKHTNCSEQITFAEITAKVLEKWKSNMIKGGMRDTTYDTYIRGLRAMINKGIKEHRLPKEGNYGFEFFVVGTPKPTKKRALHLDEIKKLFSYPTKKGSPMWKSQQLAIFIFNTNGINFVDLAYLRMNQFVGDFDRVIYTRAKTNKDFDVLIAGSSKKILKEFTKYKTLNSDELVFPIMNPNVIGTGKKEYTLYKSQRKAFNKHLAELARQCGIEGPVTSYVLRHSFATGLKRSGVEEARISEALGHDTVETTSVYLDSFETEDNDKVTSGIAF